MSENSVTKGALEQGRRLAAMLAGSWRPVPPHADFAVEDWDATVARLLETGAGGLGWWRVRESELRHLPASAKLHDAYRMHSLEAGMHEPSIAEAFDRCRRAGVEPLLAKGWAVARIYPEPGLRPFGDIDLFVRPEQHLTARDGVGGPHAAAAVAGPPTGISRSGRSSAAGSLRALQDLAVQRDPGAHRGTGGPVAALVRAPVAPWRLAPLVVVRCRGGGGVGRM